MDFDEVKSNDCMLKAYQIVVSFGLSTNWAFSKRTIWDPFRVASVETWGCMAFSISWRSKETFGSRSNFIVFGHRVMLRRSTPKNSAKSLRCVVAEWNLFLKMTSKLHSSKFFFSFYPFYFRDIADNFLEGHFFAGEEFASVPVVTKSESVIFVSSPDYNCHPNRKSHSPSRDYQYNFNSRPPSPLFTSRTAPTGNTKLSAHRLQRQK